jgi:flavin reductase (DIM6/NTAB) family NADH-FMN oxidoreductase RutF
LELIAMDAVAKKKALRMLSYGLCVATSRDEQGFAAGTINWISQSSFTPPLVMVAIKAETGLHRAIAAAGIFAVHILGKSQKDMATAFFRGAQPSDGKLNGYEIETGQTGAPVLLAPPAWFECRVVNEVRGGDHTIFVAEVVNAGIRSDEDALTLRETGFAYGG